MLIKMLLKVIKVLFWASEVFVVNLHLLTYEPCMLVLLFDHYHLSQFVFFARDWHTEAIRYVVKSVSGIC